MCVELAARRLDVADLGEEPASAGRQTLPVSVSPNAMRRTTGAISPSRPCSRRMLNIWIPYTAEELPSTRRASSSAR